MELTYEQWQWSGVSVVTIRSVPARSNFILFSIVIPPKTIRPRRLMKFEKLVLKTPAELTTVASGVLIITKLGGGLFNKVTYPSHRALKQDLIIE